MVKWDIYRCDNDHLIIVEVKKEWIDHLRRYFYCDICGEIAEYKGSAETLTEIEEKIEKGEI